MATRIETINKAIASIKRAERVTKEKLTEVSRTILEYLYLDEIDGQQGSGDITPINRLLRVLTPMNKTMAIHYFRHFVAWKFDTELEEFTTKNKKQFDKKLELVKEFLEDESNNIFTWAADNIKVEKKEVDYLAKLKRDMVKAFENGVTPQQVLDLLNELTPEEDQVKEAA